MAGGSHFQTALPNSVLRVSSGCPIFFIQRIENSMEQIQPLIHLLEGRFGWSPAVMAWMSALRLVLKPFNAKLQSKLTDLMAEDAKDPESEHDWEVLLHKRWYRLTAFILDLFFSLKLPTHVDLTRLVARGGDFGSQISDLKPSAVNQQTKES